MNFLMNKDTKNNEENQVEMRHSPTSFKLQAIILDCQWGKKCSPIYNVVQIASAAWKDELLPLSGKLEK